MLKEISFFARNRVVNTTSKQSFESLTPSETVCFGCNSPYVNYWITPSRCSLQYVGETDQKINKWCNWHNPCFKKSKKWLLLYIVLSFYKRLRNGRTTHDALNRSITLKRKGKGNEWMLKSQTIFPYELNYQLGDNLIKEETQVLIWSKFSTLPRKSTRIPQGHVHKLNTTLFLDEFLAKFKFYFQMSFLILSTSTKYIFKSWRKEIQSKQSFFLTKVLMI